MKTVQRFNRAFYAFATAGYKGAHSSKEVRHIFLATMFSVIAFVFLLIFGVEALMIGHRIRAVILFSFSLFTIINYFILRRTLRYELSNNLTVLMMSLLCFYLICTGGVDSSGPLWYFAYPLLAMYILGLKRGMVVLTLFLSISALLLFVPGIPFVTAKYTIYFKTRLLGALGVVTFMSFVYEYSRDRAQKELWGLANRLEISAKTDELTGLSNRRDMRERLLDEISRVKRGGRVFTLIICDIDHFKHVNDTHGHECGDLVLKTVSRIMVKALRRQDVVARWGGEEFLILLPETTIAGGVSVAGAIREGVASYGFEYNGQDFFVTMSFGVHSPGNISEPDMLIKKADENLYRAKYEGRNKVIAA